MPRSRNNEITIAAIGLFGILATAVFSNWNKIFHEEEIIVVSADDYRKTGVFETEYRYFFEVSGARKAMESMQQQLRHQYEIALTTEHPEDAEEIRAIFDIALEEAVSLDEVIQRLLPVYQKFFSVEELQELNKFYSTKIMQDMIRKMPLLAQEAAPIQVEMMQEFQERFAARLEEIE